MKNTILTLAAVTGLALAAPAPAHGQLSVELRGSLNNPVGDFGGEGGLNANSEAGLGADLIYSASQSLSVYGGWSREMFGCEACSGDDGLTSSGFEGGVKLLMNREEGVLPWIRGGLIAHKLKVEQDGAEFSSDTGLGFQAAAGVDIPLGEVLSFSPAVRYQAYQAEFDILGDEFVTAQEDVQQLSLDLALHVHLDALTAR